MEQVAKQQGKIKVFLRIFRGVKVRNLLGWVRRPNRDNPPLLAAALIKPHLSIALNPEELMRYSANEAWFEVVDLKYNTYYAVIPP